jgi:hypothetical protein
MKTVSGIATSYSDDLLLRAADVTLKERRRLVLLVRETPLHLGHLRLLVQVAELGAVVAPPVPAFYHRPATLEAVVDQTVNRTCDLLGIELEKDLFPRWHGPAAHLPGHNGQRNGQAPHADDCGDPPSRTTSGSTQPKGDLPNGDHLSRDPHPGPARTGLRGADNPRRAQRLEHT